MLKSGISSKKIGFYIYKNVQNLAILTKLRYATCMNYMGVIEYIGTNYHGFQKQEGYATIQSCLEEAIFKVTGETVNVEASGRTDAGVHALGQVVSFVLQTERRAYALIKSLNYFLPSSIQFVRLETAADTFHARFSAKKKTYRYVFYTSQTARPFLENRALQIPQKVDIEAMQQACGLLVGTKDWGAFVAQGSGKTDFVRTVYAANICVLGENVYAFEITGNGFLYNMVRILMGTLLAVGKGKITLTQLQTIIEKKDRTLAGETVPPYGLYLKNVTYGIDAENI